MKGSQSLEAVNCSGSIQSVRRHELRTPKERVEKHTEHKKRG